jgi:hypothetical protein
VQSLTRIRSIRAGCRLGPVDSHDVCFSLDYGWRVQLDLPMPAGRFTGTPPHRSLARHGAGALLVSGVSGQRSRGPLADVTFWSQSVEAKTTRSRHDSIVRGSSLSYFYSRYLNADDRCYVKLNRDYRIRCNIADSDPLPSSRNRFARSNQL